MLTNLAKDLPGLRHITLNDEGEGVQAILVWVDVRGRRDVDAVIISPPGRRALSAHRSSPSTSRTHRHQEHQTRQNL